MSPVCFVLKIENIDGIQVNTLGPLLEIFKKRVDQALKPLAKLSGEGFRFRQIPDVDNPNLINQEDNYYEWCDQSAILGYPSTSTSTNYSPVANVPNTFGAANRGWVSPANNYESLLYPSKIPTTQWLHAPVENYRPWPAHDPNLVAQQPGNGPFRQRCEPWTFDYHT
ncbi:uncharacterized protein KY384_001350 [Bacidia gigantensis]|uniref:uncharacterized protein n=1 Tax=Bacidia gigantensis TaxID=2732470 RepID=UPI001D053EA4|nr:uncharacterized protein KY384_001350 [Bacidia gigantensis]KAG8533610.1 hypothetical protein KY384_001350 [Bacidia gigantensis]